MTRPSKLTLEQLIYLLAVFLAVAVRFAYLGAAPLSDVEADLALKILDLLGRVPSTLGAEPGYAIPTGVLFFLFGPHTVLARFIPALLGGFLAGLPYFYRHWLGRKAALLLAIGLALDPGLIALSRQAGGAMMGITLLLAALTAWFAGRPALAGALAALGLVSGPAAVLNALVLAVVALVSRTAKLALPREESTAEVDPEGESGSIRVALASGGITLLLAGTLFMLYPSGIGAMAGVVPASFNSIVQSLGTPIARQGFALAAYQPLVLIFGIAGAIRAWTRKDDVAKMLALWLLLSLLVAVLPPGRQVWHLAWPLIPLMALASQTLAGELEWDAENGLVSSGLAAVVSLLLAFVWLHLASVARLGDASQTRVLLILGILFITGVATGLVALGWSWPAARRGLVWGLVVGFGLYSLSISSRMVSPEGSRTQELWYSQPSVVEEDLLLGSLGDLSEWSTGRREAIDVSVTLERPSLRWAMRTYDNASFAVAPGPSSMPSALVTGLFEEPTQPAAYRGADFLWLSSPAWEGAFPPNILSWIVFRDSPTQDEHIILWARNDLFPGGTIDPEEGLPVDPGPDDVP